VYFLENNNNLYIVRMQGPRRFLIIKPAIFIHKIKEFSDYFGVFHTIFISFLAPALCKKMYVLYV
jgi:hypothetical protein